MREDGKESSLENSIGALVHYSCRKNCVSAKNIKAAKAKKAEADRIFSPQKSKLRSSGLLSIARKCFFCFKDIPENYEVLQMRVEKRRRNPAGFFVPSKVYFYNFCSHFSVIYFSLDS